MRGSTAQSKSDGPHTEEQLVFGRLPFGRSGGPEVKVGNTEEALSVR